MKVLITGGASGLGLAMAKRWAQAGATVCVADRNASAQAATLQAIAEAGGIGHFIETDVSSDDSVARLKAFTDQTLGGVDLLINSAGVPTAGTVSDESLTAWQWVLDINLLGSVRLVKAYAESMRRAGQGYIVNVASQAALTPTPLMGSYNATKAAIVAFSETLRLELAPFGVGVSVLCPAFVSTALHTALPKEQHAMQALVTKLVEGGSVSAEQVAEQTFQAVQDRQFLILTHKEGKKAWRIKRWLPNAYLKMMAKRTRKFSLKGYRDEPSHSA
ncbi:SDR family oxidoreductase [Ferrimonas marina]|uniref:Short-chain dehydrogenase n=1 Tax=Ferrimonas marina TaxID=299255 RepID=A0A1M5RJL8_9GAMM|nr:SDR family oxidoreductase [Ferrimonas marina]SHH26346.1 Short-chain dehydrogenase [Ferrimonas marina]